MRSIVSVVVFCFLLFYSSAFAQAEASAEIRRIHAGVLRVGVVGEPRLVQLPARRTREPPALAHLDGAERERAAPRILSTPSRAVERGASGLLGRHSSQQDVPQRARDEDHDRGDPQRRVGKLGADSRLDDWLAATASAASAFTAAPAVGGA